MAADEKTKRTEFGAAVKREREARDWKQHELAQMVFKTQQWLLKVEKGALPVKLEDAIALADAFGVPLARLVVEPIPVNRLRVEQLAWGKAEAAAAEQLAYIDAQIAEMEVLRIGARSQVAHARARIEELSERIAETEGAGDGVDRKKTRRPLPRKVAGR